jgi:hypothetical protein
MVSHILRKKSIVFEDSFHSWHRYTLIVSPINENYTSHRRKSTFEHAELLEVYT